MNRIMMTMMQSASRHQQQDQDEQFLSRLSRGERIARLNYNDVFLPHDYIWSTVLPTIVVTWISLTLVYALSLRIVQSLQFVPPNSNLQTRRKVAYQMTNFAINLFLGVTGAYYEYKYVQQSQYTLEETVSGCRNFQLFASVQIGYQLWSIPVGIWQVQEHLPMLLHHFAVLAVAAMSAFCKNGYRYWTPFFYGMMELSSVPLALMNTFKDNPQWTKSRPQLYTAIRLWFCATFLYIRIYHFVPRKVRYLRDHYYLWSSTNKLHMPYLYHRIMYQSYMASVWIGTVFLLGLQLYWATLIVKGLSKLFTGKQRRKSGVASSFRSSDEKTNGGTSASTTKKLE